jgi:hypothetical protein
LPPCSQSRRLPKTCLQRRFDLSQNW